MVGKVIKYTLRIYENKICNLKDKRLTCIKSAILYIFLCILSVGEIQGRAEKGENPRSERCQVSIKVGDAFLC